MRHLFAPWRIEYILSEKSGGCIFCHSPATRRSKKKLILYAGASTLVMLNRYPYTNCHLLVAPRRHTSTLSNLSDREMHDLFSTLRSSVDLLKRAIKPAGFNIGMNVGRTAGAGVAGHLHLHIVPRWRGDTNFMPILAESTVIPEHLQKAYDRLAPFFSRSFVSA